MSKIVDTDEGSFRFVTDGTNKWWLWECAQCGERQPVDLDNSVSAPCEKCGHVGRNLGRALVAHMQARVLVGDEPTHDEDQRHRHLNEGVDGP